MSQPAPSPTPTAFSWSDPAWVSAIGQISAAILTVVAVVIALVVAFADARSRRREQRDRETAQARQIFAEVGIDDGKACAIVTNHSNEAITMVQPTLVLAPEMPADVRTQWQVSPSSRGDILTLLQPGQQFPVPYQHLWPEGQTRPPIRYYTVTFEFTDSRGFRWSRTGRDQPVRLTG